MTRLLGAEMNPEQYRQSSTDKGMERKRMRPAICGVKEKQLIKGRITNVTRGPSHFGIQA